MIKEEILSKYEADPELKLILTVSGDKFLNNLKEYCANRTWYNTVEFLVKYYPNIFQKTTYENIYIFIKFYSRVFIFLTHCKQKNIDYRISSETILDDVDEFLQNEEGVWGYDYVENPHNLFYTAERLFKALRDMQPKESHVVLKPLFSKKTPDDDNKTFEIDGEIIDSTYLSNYDLKYKIIYSYAAIMCDKPDIEYNKEVLDDLELLTKAVLDDKYYWYNEEINLFDIINTYFIDIKDNEFIQKTNKFLNNKVSQILKKIAIIEQNAFCAYANYQYQPTPEKFKWFLQLSLLNAYYCTDSKCPWDIWENIKSMNENELLNNYIELVDSYFMKIKKLENKVNFNNINSDIIKKPINLCLKNIPAFITNNSVGKQAAGNFKIDNPPFYGSLYFKMDKYIVQTIFNLFYYFSIYKVPKFQNNVSYLKILEALNVDIKDLKEVEYECFEEVNIIDLFPDNYDFTGLLDYLELLKEDNKVKHMYRSIIQGKEILYSFSSNLSFLLNVIKKPEYKDIYYKIQLLISPIQIRTFCFADNIIKAQIKTDIQEDRILKAKQRYEIINAYKRKLKPMIDTISTPSSLVDYLNNKNLTSEEGDIDTLFDEIIESEIKKIEDAVKKWDTYSLETVSLRFSEYFKNLKNKIKNLCNDTNYIFEKSINFITTGEAMYNAFIPKNIILGDYGSLAINYYKALECLINEIFYKPYKKDVLDDLIQRNDLNQTKENMYGYIGAFNPPIRDDIMLGQMIHFFTNGSDNSRIYMIEYFEQRGVAFSKMKEFINKVNKISKLRNNCAHPQITTLPYAILGRSAVYKRENIDTIVEEQLRDIHELIFDIINVFY